MRPGVAGCSWVTVAVGSQLGSQLGFPGLRRPRQFPDRVMVQTEVLQKLAAPGIGQPEQELAGSVQQVENS
jgi:hypothetical protein